MLKLSLRMVYKGGPGSGHHGHEGRPGKRGGSAPGGGGPKNLPGGPLPSNTELGKVLGVDRNDRGGNANMRWSQGRWKDERRAKSPTGKNVYGEVTKNRHDDTYGAVVDYAYAQGEDAVVTGGAGMDTSGWYPTRRAAMYALYQWHELAGTFD